jgi:hypothetical protein
MIVTVGMGMVVGGCCVRMGAIVARRLRMGIRMIVVVVMRRLRPYRRLIVVRVWVRVSMRIRVPVPPVIRHRERSFQPGLAACVDETCPL